MKTLLLFLFLSVFASLGYGQVKMLYQTQPDTAKAPYGFVSGCLNKIKVIFPNKALASKTWQYTTSLGTIEAVRGNHIDLYIPQDSTTRKVTITAKSGNLAEKVEVSCFPSIGGIADCYIGDKTGKKVKVNVSGMSIPSTIPLYLFIEPDSGFAEFFPHEVNYKFSYEVILGSGQIRARFTSSDNFIDPTKFVYTAKTPNKNDMKFRKYESIMIKITDAHRINSKGGIIKVKVLNPYLSYFFE